MYSSTQDLAPAEVIPAIEANLTALWRSYSRLPGAELHDDPDLLWIATTVPFAPFNGVVRTHLRPETVDGAIDATLRRFTQRQVPMLWLLTPGTRPPDLGRRLLARGLVRVVDDPGMALDLHRLPDELPMPPGFAVERVDEPVSLRDWCGFAEGPVAEGLVAWGSANGFAPDRAIYQYLGRLDGRPVATSSLVLDGDAAGIYNVMTVPDAQRRGIGALMTAIPLRAARERGYRLGVLQSSRIGHTLYRRLGFHEYCRIEGYLWPPPDTLAAPS